MRSIRTRLLVLLIPVTAVALVVSAVGIERAVHRDLKAARDSRILLLARGIGSAVEIEVDGAVEFELGAGEMPEFGQSVAESFYAIADEKGSILFSSTDPPPGLLSGAEESPVYVDAEVDGETMRVCLISIYREPESDDEDRMEWLAAHPGEELPPSEPQWFRVAAGLPDQGLRDTMLLIRRRLIVGFGFLCALLVFVPIWMAGLSLGPLRRLSRQAEEVGADNPDVRLEEEGVDREVRSLVKALNRALDRLGKAYEQQRSFTADAAHELRSPLSAIRAQCEVTLRKERNREDLTEVLGSVHRTTLRLGGIVENLLSLSRLQNGSSVIERKPVDLAGTAREAVSLLGALAHSRETHLEEKLPERITVSGDRRLLLECFSNILDNAIRYTPVGGTITVEGGDGRRPWISVSDTGPGIPEEQIGRIFERFYRVDSSRSRADGGSGLGLSIAKAIAGLHGAVITVESSPGRGSRFQIAFGPPA